MSWTVKTWDGTTETERFPEYESINFRDFLVSDQVYYRKEVTTTFKFTGTDYTYLHGLFTSNYCGTLDLRLYEGVTLRYTAQIKLRKNTDWDEDNCRVEVAGIPKDAYNTLFANWDEKINILSGLAGVSLIEVSTLAGTIETTTVETEGSGPPDDPPGPASSTWVVVNSVDTGSEINQIWARETITVACSGGVPVSPGDDWTLAEDNCPTDARYVRPVEVYLKTQTSTYDFDYGIVGVDTSNNAETYDNGRLFSEIIEYFATQAGFSVVSDVLNINNDDTHPANDAYTASDPNLHLLSIFQKSDILRFDAAANATVGELTLKEMIEFLEEMLSIKYTASGSNLRLEHESFFEAGNGEDLTVTFPDNIKGKNNYAFVESDSYPREQYEWMDQDPQGGIDFVGRDITYDCADEEEDPKQIRISQVSTDFSGMQGNPEAYQDAGFALLSLGQSGSNFFIRKDLGVLSGTYQLNAHLSWANIHDNYKRHQRPQPTGTINGAAVTFDSVKPRRRQEPITITKTITEYFAWNPSLRIKTGLGWGKVESAEYNSKTCQLTITLLYD